MTIGMELLMELSVQIGEAYEVGVTPYGERRVVPITGGEFNGPKIRGVVLPGGADWNVKRADGVKELCARYTLQTDDGTLISVLNEGFIHVNEEEGTRYARTVPKLEVAGGQYQWINNSVFVGTHESRREESRVLLKFYFIT